MNKKLTTHLFQMDPVDINVAAIEYLDALLERCTLNFAADLTGLSRPMFYRWLDPERPYEDMDHVRAGWFIMQCENNPKLQLLLKRPPLSHPRMATKLVGDSNDNAQS